MTPQKISALESVLSPYGLPRRYAVGGNLAWLAWSGAQGLLDTLLTQQGLAGLTVLGQTEQPFLGDRTGHAFIGRIKQALDPANRFCNL